MTVPTQSVRVSYVGDGSTTTFALPFVFYAATDVLVLLNGALQTTGYTITGGNDSTGSVVFTAAPALNAIVMAILAPPLQQTVNLSQGVALPPSTLNQQADRAVMLAQRLADQVSRAIAAPDADLSPNMTLPVAALRPNTLIGFDDTGLNIELVSTTPSEIIGIVNQGQFDTLLAGAGAGGTVGQVPTVAAGNAIVFQTPVVPLFVSLTSLQTITSNTSWTATPLAIAIPGAGTYQIEALLFFYLQTASTGGLKFSFAYSGTASDGLVALQGYVNAATYSSPGGVLALSNNQLFGQTAIDITGTLDYLHICGLVRFTSAGTYTLYWGQDISSADAGYLAADSWLKLSPAS